ncbi:delta and Notch-like EGF repeat containing weary [Arctopsyche grandis]|uniref:delta and Notch-like EGF repeat containing weary n=1 Tax=Arctopsyche grandis TaxID=121162 RepID=UPI00406D8FB3
MGTSYMVAALSAMAIVCQAFTTPIVVSEATSRVTRRSEESTVTTLKPTSTSTSKMPLTSNAILTTLTSANRLTTGPDLTITSTIASTSTVMSSTERRITTKSVDVTSPTTVAKTTSPKQTSATVEVTTVPVNAPPERIYPARTPSRLDERLEALDCDIPLLPAESRLWRGNETHELMLPITIPEECPGGVGTPSGGDDDCLPMVLSWGGAAEVQSGDILLVRIDDSQLTLAHSLLNHTTKTDLMGTHNSSDGEDIMHHTPQTAVYQVTRQGHEHCDVTEGVLLDITPLLVDGKKLVTLYDKDLTEGVNLLIVVSESWGTQCVRLKVTVKSDNCGDNQDCSDKGVCYSNISMEGYECQCCPGFVGPHCEEQDACFPSPCTNNGICVDISQGHEGVTYQCLCPYGYTGKNCQEEVDPCSSSPCQNGATCSGNMSLFRCDCPRGFAGLLCQHALNECESSPCVHGICVDQEDGYKCYCQPGFAGDHCEYEYDECQSSPCINGGTCTDHVGSYTCTCGRGFTGKRCHIKVDLCSPNPCSAHHYCMDRGNNYSCECPRGYAGPDCLMPAAATCNTNPCANGGTCWSSVDSFYCACRPGYTGKTCEEDFVMESVGEATGPQTETDVADGAGGVREVRIPMTLYHDRLHNVYMAAGTMGAAIAIVGIVVTACHCRVNKTYQRWLSRVSGKRRAPEPGPPHHWLSEKQPPAATRPLPPLETHDMYYTLDFSDSQSSPLIQ